MLPVKERGGAAGQDLGVAEMTSLHVLSPRGNDKTGPNSQSQAFRGLGMGLYCGEVIDENLLNFRGEQWASVAFPLRLRGPHPECQGEGVLPADQQQPPCRRG